MPAPAPRMRDLNVLLARAEENATAAQQVAADAVQDLRDIKARITQERRRRGHLRGLVFIPVSLSSAALAARWLSAHKAVIASTAGGAATGAAVAAIGIAALAGPGAANHPATPAPAYVGALPPSGHNPPPTGPPKSGPPAPAASKPLRLPAERSGAAPRHGSAPPTTPPVTRPSTDPPPIDPGPPTTTAAGQQCRIPLPKLHICLLPLPLSRRS